MKAGTRRARWRAALAALAAGAGVMACLHDPADESFRTVDLPAEIAILSSADSATLVVVGIRPGRATLAQTWRRGDTVYAESSFIDTVVQVYRHVTVIHAHIRRYQATVRYRDTLSLDTTRDAAPKEEKDTVEYASAPDSPGPLDYRYRFDTAFAISSAPPLPALLAKDLVYPESLAGKIFFPPISRNWAPDSSAWPGGLRWSNAHDTLSLFWSGDSGGKAIGLGRWDGILPFGDGVGSQATMPFAISRSFQGFAPSRAQVDSFWSLPAGKFHGDSALFSLTAQLPAGTAKAGDALAAARSKFQFDGDFDFSLRLIVNGANDDGYSVAALLSAGATAESLFTFSPAVAGGGDEPGFRLTASRSRPVMGVYFNGKLNDNQASAVIAGHLDGGALTLPNACALRFRRKADSLAIYAKPDGASDFTVIDAWSVPVTSFPAKVYLHLAVADYAAANPVSVNWDGFSIRQGRVVRP